MEIVTELSMSYTDLDPWSAAYGFAFAIWQQVKRRKVIRSFGFIVRRLLELDDTSWAFDIPSKLSPECQDWTMKWARHLIVVANNAGVKTLDRRLVGTVQIEELQGLIGSTNGRDRTKAFEQKVSTAKPVEEGKVVWGWTYFSSTSRPQISR
jgi:hypothetical protein